MSGSGNNSNRKSSTKLKLGRCVLTDVHGVLEYMNMIEYDSDKLPIKDKLYFEECRNDLRTVLLVYKGIRVRDLRSSFKTQCGYDIDFERLNLKNWTQFILVNQTLFELRLSAKLDREDHEEVYALLSDSGKTEIHKDTQHMQSLLNTTPDEKNGPFLLQFPIISAKEAFIKGFLDVANGHARYDPRVPIQDMGVAAAKTLQRVTKLTFEQQMALAEANRHKEKKICNETQAPKPESKNGSLASFFSGIPSKPAERDTLSLFNGSKEDK